MRGARYYPGMSTAEPTVCIHCGEPTRGGEYAPGHDSKHRGELHRAVMAGEITEKQARAELPSLALANQLSNDLARARGK